MQYSNELIKKAADNLRVIIIAMVEKSKSGHPGGAMGAADFMTVLYSEFLNYDPSDPEWPFRDRFFLDPGHMSPILYSVLTMTGLFSMDDIKQFRQLNSLMPGHPELDIARGIENISGPLGMGHSMAMGSAVAERFIAQKYSEKFSHKIYTLISDGGIQSEISQGAGRLAGHLGLSNLVMFYDSNDIQLSSKTEDTGSEETSEKYAAWGWKVIKIDGNDIGQIRDSLKDANAEKEKPVLIIGKTVMGKGLVCEDGSSFERQVSTHGMPVSKAGASVEKSIKKLGGDPENPFSVSEEVERFFKDVNKEKAEISGNIRNVQSQWKKENSQKAKLLDELIKGKARDLDISELEDQSGIATRASSGKILSILGEKYSDNMIVISADLSNSDKTDGFLKKTSIMRKDDFRGSFLQAGVSELTMASAANGIALHGIIPVCGTFFVFSDYMKPAVRLASLMGLPVKYVWTHDSFRVGEDGPTHQPVEHEAQIRLMEKIKNFRGERSMKVFRPADFAETAVSWKIALENTGSPSAFILTRQNVGEIPGMKEPRMIEAFKAEKGGYIIMKTKDRKADIVLVANGSEVSLILEAGKIVESGNPELNIQYVSMISPNIFLDQPEDYREDVIPAGTPVYGVTSGLPDTFLEVAGRIGCVYGMNRFGLSAPFELLEKEFGFTPEKIAENIMGYIRKNRTEMENICNSIQSRV